jgi:undecaprenyl diphosphate synthase
VNARSERLDPARLPRHVAIIMDGNRRWAKERRLPAVEGHRRGIVALREATRAARDLGIEVLTVYGFSTENWRRDESEISLLLDLCVYFARSEMAELTRNDVQVHVIGHYQVLPRAAREALERLVAATAGNRGLRLVLAINYSARAELRDAAGALAGEVLAGTLEAEDIDERRLAAQLYTSQFGDPELLIRPGGESRLSNFLLFQVAHAELYMTDTYWPDFRREHFVAALTAYQARRASGGV